MKKFFLLLLLGLFSVAQAQIEPAETIRLWPGDAPGALGNSNYDIPTITLYLPKPEAASGAALVILPGGGYGGLAAHEGPGYARWLSNHGITCFVLTYRLGSHGYRHPVMLEDAARAVRLVRSRAADWKLDPRKIGIMGSSAGGHLASTLLTHFDAGDEKAADPIDRQSSRPDLGILCYPVITMGTNTHAGSRRNLLGDNPSPELIELLSNEKQVTDKTPRCFIFHTWEDNAVKVENSLEFAAALRAHNIPFDLHIYTKGAHGMGLGGSNESSMHPWTRDLLFWLRLQGYLK